MSYVKKHICSIVNIFKDDPVETKEDNAKETCCSDGANDGPCCNEGTDNSATQLPRCRRTAFAFFINDFIKQSHFVDNQQKDKSIFVHSWKALTNEEKSYYHKLSKDDKVRYQRELQEYKQKIQCLQKTIEPIVNPINQPEVKQTETASDDFGKENNQKPFSGNYSDLDDMAFDIFCTDEMPKVREKFAPINRRMSGEEMLDELLQRWDSLPDNLRDVYLHKAKNTIDVDM